MTKISALSTATPTRSDEIFGNAAGTTTKRQTNLASLALARDIRTFIPKGPTGKLTGDTTSPTSTASSTSNANAACWYPMFIPEPCTLATIEARVGTLEVGSLCRLGIYTITAISTTLTGALVADFGTVAGDTTGIKQLSVSQALTRGLYALCAANSNHSTVRWRRCGPLVSPIYGESTTVYGATAGWKASTDYSAGLPANIPAVTAFPGDADGTTEVLVTFT